MRLGSALVVTTGMLGAGCNPGLEEGFEESLTRGHACGDAFVVMANDAETIRLQASFEDYAGEPTPADARLVLFTGVRLMHFDNDPCDDVINVAWGTLQQHIACRYDQVSGVVTPEVEDGTVTVVTEGVTLRPGSDHHARCADYPDVAMVDGEWPSGW